MPEQFRRASDVLREYLAGEKENEARNRNLFRATLLRLNGTVSVPARANWVNYKPFPQGQPGMAFNWARVLEQDELSVIVGFPLDANATTPCIMGLDPDVMQDNTQFSPYFAQHAPDHRYMGVDHEPLDLRSIQDLMILPGGDFVIKVMAGRYDWYGRQNYYGGSEIDLTDEQPATAGKRAVGLYLDVDNLLQSVSGSIVAEAPGTSLSAPVLPAGVFEVGFIKLYASKSFADKEDIANRKVAWGSPLPDFHEIRFFL
jgi:hypothetical protein